MQFQNCDILYTDGKNFVLFEQLLDKIVNNNNCLAIADGIFEMLHNKGDIVSGSEEIF